MLALFTLYRASYVRTYIYVDPRMEISTVWKFPPFIQPYGNFSVLSYYCLYIVRVSQPQGSGTASVVRKYVLTVDAPVIDSEYLQTALTAGTYVRT